jgi:hypothetical protein
MRRSCGIVKLFASFSCTFHWERQAERVVDAPAAGPYRGAVADLTGDGKPSILRLGWKATPGLNGSMLNTILNKGNRQFVKTSSFVVGAGGTANANGSFTPFIVDMAAGNISAGAGVDAALVASDSSVKVYYGASGGIFLPTPVNVTDHGGGAAVTIGDFIGVGTQDIAISESQGGGYPDYHIIFNNGRGQLTFTSDAPRLPGLALGMITARFPGFAHDSIVGVTSDGTIGYAYGGAATGATFANPFTRGIGSTNQAPGGPVNFDELLQDGMRLPTALPQDNIGRILATADIDASGLPAFAVAASDAVYIVQWRMTGAGNQYVRQTLTLPGGLAPDSVTLAPLAEGNRPSLVVTAKTAGFYVFVNDGTGHFNPTPVKIDTPFRVGIETDVVDFDGDGIADIAVNDIDNDRVAVYFVSREECAWSCGRGFAIG